ncbi:type-1 glutamine synthetase-like [Raphidocelis subcapitata]|uniref:Type-1 glutamine synthetase-like n=1 Tax=Raphidocelis subcapitata TaxID=307507 RepID=A0A2V0NVX0_9CHLO|nr:type-1 glutamine synthetase-like [Raphidocelis subcapitata]|eukprot:GBF89703.1 type-1 glutamine synthetase-like [Raphidocelis subcapitata]
MASGSRAYAGSGAADGTDAPTAVPARQLHALRLIWTDCAGLRRCRVLPLAAPGGALPAIGLTKACNGMGVNGDSLIPASGLTASGEVRLTPDPSTYVPQLPWYPAHGMACCDLLERSGAPWSCCPRSALARCLGRLSERCGLTLRAGFELEFVLLRPTAAPPGGLGGSGWEPVDSALYCLTSGFDAQCAVLDAMVSALLECGIGVVQYHKEAAPGQFEIATAPADALLAADRLVQSKEVISAVARRHGLAVTFVPKPMAKEAGSGCHMHLSLWKDGESAMPGERGGADGSPSLSAAASAFFGGVLSHLPALLPFMSPSCGTDWGSYARLRPGCWAGAFACWGWDNREAPLRATRPGGAETTNFELKSTDGTTNPYIALAAVACAGGIGLEYGAALPPPVDGAPEGAAPALPGTLAEALAALEADRPLRAAVAEGLGPELVRAYLAVRAGEAEARPSLRDVLLRY